jgi:DNA-binding CsgD family transcriptional regulator
MRLGSRNPQRESGVLMSATVKRAAHEKREPSRDETALKDFVRQIMHEQPEEAPLGAAADECVIADTELDGARYLLLRVPKLPPVSLSPREQEIVRMVAQGQPNKVIADVLNISSWTVGTHLRRIFAKCGVGSRAAMIARLHRIE